MGIEYEFLENGTLWGEVKSTTKENKIYTVIIYTQDEELTWACGCPAGTYNDNPCKHVKNLFHSLKRDEMIRLLKTVPKFRIANSLLEMVDKL